MLSRAWLCCTITVYVLLHFRNTSNENALSDSLDLLVCTRMPLWLNMSSTGAFNAGTDNARTLTRIWFYDGRVWVRQNWNGVQSPSTTRLLQAHLHLKWPSAYDIKQLKKHDLYAHDTRTNVFIVAWRPFKQTTIIFYKRFFLIYSIFPTSKEAFKEKYNSFKFATYCRN